MIRAGACVLIVGCAAGPDIAPPPVDAPEVAVARTPVAAAVPTPAVNDRSIPELPQVWSAPQIQLEAAMVDGGAGVVGRWSEHPQTIVRVDARTGTEQWRVARPGDVIWLHVRAGTTHAAISGRLPAGGGQRYGSIDLRDGRLLWSHALADRTDVIVGADGTGIGLVHACDLTVVDPATGRGSTTLHGRTLGIGHAGPHGSTVDEHCSTPPVLLGRTGECSVVLVPEGAADMTIVAVGAASTCWRLELGRVDDRVTVDAATAIVGWHAHATLHVAALDRTAGRLRWQRTFAGPQCYPTAHLGPDGAGGPMVVVNACGQVSALATDGAVRWTAAARADAVVVVGEDDTTARLADSPGVRWLQLMTVSGEPTGRIEVPDGASAHAIAAGVLIDTRESLVLHRSTDGGVAWQRKHASARWSTRDGYLFIKGAPREGTVIVEADTGRPVGRDPFAADPLAVVRADGRELVVMRAGYLWARALP